MYISYYVTISYCSSKSKMTPNSSAMRTSLRSIVLNHPLPQFVILYSSCTASILFSPSKGREVFVVTLWGRIEFCSSSSQDGCKVYLFSCSLSSHRPPSSPTCTHMPHPWTWLSSTAYPCCWPTSSFLSPAFFQSWSIVSNFVFFVDTCKIDWN